MSVRTTGMNSYQWQSSSTTITSTPEPSRHLPTWTLVNILAWDSSLHNLRPAWKQSMNSALAEAKAALAKAQEDMTCYYNQCREPAPEYAPGDKVYLDGSDIRTSRPSKKLT